MNRFGNWEGDFTEKGLAQAGSQSPGGQAHNGFSLLPWLRFGNERCAAPTCWQLLERAFSALKIPFHVVWGLPTPLSAVLPQK